MLNGSEASLGFAPPERKQIVQCDAELLLGITPEVLPDQGRLETVETRRQLRYEW